MYFIIFITYIIIYFITFVLYEDYKLNKKIEGIYTNNEQKILEFLIFLKVQQEFYFINIIIIIA